MSDDSDTDLDRAISNLERAIESTIGYPIGNVPASEICQHGANLIVSLRDRLKKFES